MTDPDKVYMFMTYLPYRDYPLFYYSTYPIHRLHPFHAFWALYWATIYILTTYCIPPLPLHPYHIPAPLRLGCLQSKTLQPAIRQNKRHASLFRNPFTEIDTYSIFTQNLTRKNAAGGPLSYSSFSPPRSSGNLSAICRISTAYIHSTTKCCKC